MVRRGTRSRIALVASTVGVIAGTLAVAASAADRVYWGGYGASTPRISFANLDGSGGGDLNSGLATVDEPFGIAIDLARGRILWANDGGSAISFANLNNTGGGGNLNTSGVSVYDPEGIAIDPAIGRVYWTNTPGGPDTGVSFANLNNTGGGGHLNTSGATVNNPEGIAIDPAAGKVYWGDNGGSPKRISFANLNNTGGGGTLNTGAAIVNNPGGMAIDPTARRIYWTNFSGTSISFANLDNTGGGGTLNTNGATVDHPLGLGIDPIAGKIYWANDSGPDQGIWFANLDNTGGGGKVLTGMATVDGPAFATLLERPRSAATPAVTGGNVAATHLACSRGRWAGDLLGAFLYRIPQHFAYRWSRNGVDNPGATASSYNATLTGVYRCRVSATNAAGTTQQTSAPHKVFPKAKITKAKISSAKGRARFTFISSGGGNGFQCALVNKHKKKKGKKPTPSFSACKSPKRYKNLTPGKYTFEVRALSSAGAGPAAKRGFAI